LTRQYIEVEKLRLGDRLRVRWDLGELPIEPAVEGGEVRIYGRLHKNLIVLSVSNSLPQEGGKQERSGK